MKRSIFLPAGIAVMLIGCSEGRDNVDAKEDSRPIYLEDARMGEISGADNFVFGRPKSFVNEQDDIKCWPIEKNGSQIGWAWAYFVTENGDLYITSCVEYEGSSAAYFEEYLKPDQIAGMITTSLYRVDDTSLDPITPPLWSKGAYNQFVVVDNYLAYWGENNNRTAHAILYDLDRREVVTEQPVAVSRSYISALDFSEPIFDSSSRAVVFDPNTPGISGDILGGTGVSLSLPEGRPSKANKKPKKPLFERKKLM